MMVLFFFLKFFLIILVLLISFFYAHQLYASYKFNLSTIEHEKLLVKMNAAELKIENLTKAYELNREGIMKRISEDAELQQEILLKINEQINPYALFTALIFGTIFIVTAAFIIKRVVLPTSELSSNDLAGQLTSLNLSSTIEGQILLSQQITALEKISRENLSLIKEMQAQTHYLLNEIMILRVKLDALTDLAIGSVPNISPSLVEAAKIGFTRFF